jgi:hypothetical protein
LGNVHSMSYRQRLYSSDCARFLRDSNRGGPSTDAASICQKIPADVTFGPSRSS